MPGENSPLPSSPPVRYTEVRIAVPQGWGELVADSLSDAPVSGGFVFGTTSIASAAPPAGHEWLRTYLPESQDGAAARDAIQSSLKTLAERSGIEELQGLSVEFREMPPEDYATSWRKSWKPFRVGQLCVLPPWRKATEGAQPRPHDRVLTLEPGGAFGSGRHATTRTCLKVLQERMRGGERVLDAGSGSGILSVTSALLGAESCLGFDVQTEAQAFAEHLAQTNGVADRCTFLTAGFECVREGDDTYQVVLANIYSDVVSDNATRLVELLEPGGWFAFSGCPIHHRDSTYAAIEGAGLRIEEDRRRGRWHTFVGVHA